MENDTTCKASKTSSTYQVETECDQGETPKRRSLPKQEIKQNPWVHLAIHSFAEHLDVGTASLSLRIIGNGFMTNFGPSTRGKKGDCILEP